MEQFDLSVWLKDKSRKVVTRTGKPVRIVCWDSPNKTFPIVGFVDNEEEIFVWDCFGYCREGHIESDVDLFFADEEVTETRLKKLNKECYECCASGPDPCRGCETNIQKNELLRHLSK